MAKLTEATAKVGMRIANCNFKPRQYAKITKLYTDSLGFTSFDVEWDDTAILIKGTGKTTNFRNWSAWEILDDGVIILGVDLGGKSKE